MKHVIKWYHLTTEKWIYRHLRSDGTVHPSAVEAHIKVTEALERNKEKENQPNSSNVISAELEEVFGRKKMVVFVGTHLICQRSKVEMATIGYAALQQKDNENALKLNKIEVEVECMGGKLIGVEGELGSLAMAVKEILNFLKHKEPNSSTRIGTPSPEKGSNSHLVHQNNESMDQADSLSNDSPSLHVEQLDNGGRVVASGCVVTSDYCHCRKVKPTKKKVYIEEVHDQSSLVWDGPQGDDIKFLRQLELPN